MHRTIAVVQPYLAQYQLPFFELSRDRLLEHGISLEVLAGSPSASRRKRRDQANIAFSHAIPVMRLPNGFLKFDYQDSRLSKCSSAPDAVILEQATRHLDSYYHLIRSRFGGPAVAFWGHGRAFHRNESKSLRNWRASMTNAASWFFAYTGEGADSVAEAGFPRDRISILNNATDTRSLIGAMASISSDTRQSFMDAHGLSSSNTAIFIGGIDEGKDIETLVKVCTLVSQVNPKFRCLVVGAGSLEHLLTSRDAIESGVRFLGRLYGNQKALALSVADIALIPREVGLVAVDALAADIPVVTQAKAGHGPEFAYLIEGSSVFTSTAGAEALSDLVRRVLTERRLLQGTSILSKPAVRELTVEQMSLSFSDGVVRWLELVCK